jgi:hypothetical protein
MSTMRIPLTLFILLGVAPTAVRAERKPAGDATAQYIEYKCVPELGQINITDCSVRGEKSVKYLQDHAKDLAARGIYPCTDDGEQHCYPNSSKVAGHTVESVIVIDPPTGEGENGQYWTQRLVLRVDGRKKINCTLGTSADGNLWVSRITIHPEDGTIEARAINGDGTELTLPEDYESIDDPHVITDDDFFADDGGAPEMPETLKV